MKLQLKTKTAEGSKGLQADNDVYAGVCFTKGGPRGIWSIDESETRGELFAQAAMRGHAWDWWRRGGRGGSGCGRFDLRKLGERLTSPKE